jgi:DNA-binding FadR family transcriptional regulator
VDPVTIAASIAAVKGVLKTAKDVQQIGNALGDLFHNQEQHAKKSPNKKKKKPKTRMQQVLRIRAGDEGYDDDTSISAVASDVLAEKQNYLALQGLAKEIDIKWGKGTWSAIKEEQIKRVKERKEANKKAKKRAREQAEEDKKFYKKVAKETGKALFLLCFVSGLIWWFIYILESKAQ